MTQRTLSALTIFLLLMGSYTFGQSNTGGSDRQSALYLEFFGNSLSYSLNYDTRFLESNKGIGGRIGIGYFSNGRSSSASIPLMVNYLWGKDRYFFEAGAGAVFYHSKNTSFLGLDGSNLMGTLTLGIRYQPISSGLFFKLAMTPVFGKNLGSLANENPGFAFIPYYAGFCVGYAF